MTVAQEVRATVWERSEGRCSYCGHTLNPFRDFSIDHVLPVSENGTSDVSNLVAACLDCNRRKQGSVLIASPMMVQLSLPKQKATARIAARAKSLILDDYARLGLRNWDRNEIKKLRLDLRLTQEEFALRLDSSPWVINRWENGRSSPRLRSIRKLDALLLIPGLSPSAPTGGEG